MTLTSDQWTILGAGAVGHLLACGFAMATVPVTLAHRREPQYNQTAVNYCATDKCCPCIINYQCINNLPPIDNLLLTVKSYQVEHAILSVKDNLSLSSKIFLLQNGMGTLEKVTSLLKDIVKPEQIYPGVNTHGTYLRADKNNTLDVVHAGSGKIVFGHNYLLPAVVNKPESVADLQQLPLNIHWSSDIQQQLWLKLAVNAAINPLTALNQSLNGELVISETLKQQVKSLCYETAALFNKLELNIHRQAIENEVFEVIAKTANNQSSMLQDIKSAQRTEIEAITGYLLEKAKEVDIRMNNHQTLYNKILSIQKT